jgi:hypothetical protein
MSQFLNPIMKRISLLLVIALVACLPALSQIKYQTRAENSDYKSTSKYNDVMDFITQLKKGSKLIKVEPIAVSAEGRVIPLMIIANPMPKTATREPGDDRITVYIQANIHAGEVEGKEAVQMFAREILSQKEPEILKHVIFLICPVFNPDGNEKISPLNRTNQNGPVNGVGVRYNGQMLDLNRDAMKAESPEVRGVISRVFNAWDPAIFMDCHTTDGSFHVEPVTFTWMVNPDGDTSLIRYMRTRMMPEMSGNLLNKYKTENCYYGEFFDLMDPSKGWEYDASEPRYMTNYYGLRNRLSILNENYVHADFRARVEGCFNLIKTLADYSAEHYAEIKNLLKNVDKATIERGMNPSVSDSFAIEYKCRPLDQPVTVRTFEAEKSSEPNIWPPFKMTDRQINVTVPYFADYYPVKKIKFPYGWILTVKDRDIIDLLELHGIKLEKISQPVSLNIERFELSGLTPARMLNQGHYTETVKGRYIAEKADFQPGTIIIRSSQPLANLAAYLLEPQTNDGLLTWNYFDKYLVPQWGQGYNPYPVYRIPGTADIKSMPFE